MRQSGQVTITTFGSGGDALTADTEYWVSIKGYISLRSAWHYIRTLPAGPVAPVFTDGASTTLSLQVGHANGASVGTVGATDGNGDTLTYSLSGTNAGSFTIDSATGEISVKTGVNLTAGSYSVTVSVTDGKDSSGNDQQTPTTDATIAVTITVSSTPAAPVFTDGASTTFSIEKGHADGASVGTVTATDANGDTLTYTLGGTDGSSFTIESATGEIKVKSGVELAPGTYEVEVSVQDGKAADGTDEPTPMIDATITVTINVTTRPPSAPAVLTLTPTTPVSLDLIWTLPDDLGTSAAITGYEVRYFAGTADPTDEANWITFDEDSGVPDPGTLTKGQILGLMPETAYRVQVRALGDTEAETSDWRASVQATTPAALANSAVLITNFQRALHTNNIILKDNDYATGFTTGSHDAGYRLGSIQLFFRSVTAGTFTGHDVRVYLATGLPSADSTVTVVAELASPKLIQTQGSGVMSNFTAPPNTVLASGTTYFVVVQATSPTKLPDNQIPLTIARGMGYDTVPAAGWSIANVGLTRGSTSTGAWTEHTETGSDNPNTTPMAFRINAAPINDLVFQSAEAVGNQVILTYTRDIDATSVPATGAFTVEVNRGAAVISDVELSGKQVILTLAGAGLFAGDAVVVSYTKPATNPLKDTDGGEAAELNRHEFTVEAKVAGVEITSYPGDNSTYGEGEAIQVTATFNEPVNVDLTGGRPQLEVDLHNTANHGEFKAIYKRGSGTNKLIFEYRVVSGNATSSTTGDGVAVTANSLELNGGSITTVQGAVTVDLAHDGLAHDTDHKVDGSHSRRHPAGEQHRASGLGHLHGLRTV